MRRIWEWFTNAVVVAPAEEEAKKILQQTRVTKTDEDMAAAIIEGAKRREAKFWQEFDRIPRGLVAADQAFPRDWDITESLVKELIEKLKKWSKDYENNAKGGGGAGADGGRVQPVTGS